MTPPAPLDNKSVARTLLEIADLLELKGENPFKIRAYRNAADIVAHAAEAVSDLDEAALRGWNGIGKDLAGRIREIASTGDCAVRRDLLTEFPATLLDVLRLQGVGPKTVAVLYKELRIKSLDDLAAAAKAGRIRGVKGMGGKKEQLILQAIEERQRFAGRHLLSRATEMADAVVAYLQEHAPAAEIATVGSVRRGTETSGDLDILASGADTTLADAFARFPMVERVLANGGTKASVLLRGGFQADLRIVTSDQRGAALQYFTGSKAHNIALRDRALERGLKLNEYGLFDTNDKAIAGAKEQDIYTALGLAYIEPELRENRGEIEAAADKALPSLITRADLKGDVHMHTTESDGRESLETMVAAAKARGLEYIAITDHSQSLAMANGLDETRAMANAERIRNYSKTQKGITVLAGIECDILADGSMDLADDCLAALDIVVASIHSALTQDERDMTARVVRAIEHPSVDIIGHLTARMLLRRDGTRVNVEKVIDAARANGVALEINSQPHRLDLCDSHARLARDRGVALIIDSDAHYVEALDYPRWGVMTARRAWLTKDDVMNTRPLKKFLAGLRRNL
ncbi:MAG TPA: DNA polymerase/3'-5' exonuclease PolX [Vicinamibacterales bacterium]|jgi:DNA polymerase (family 10)|nr:DNA polymerase/3'-5' exonuclease PolX [Vicinamibacterales bacterium]